jgi:hypothetical protein
MLRCLVIGLGIIETFGRLDFKAFLKRHLRRRASSISIWTDRQSALPAPTLGTGTTFSMELVPKSDTAAFANSAAMEATKTYGLSSFNAVIAAMVVALRSGVATISVRSLANTNSLRKRATNITLALVRAIANNPRTIMAIVIARHAPSSS